VSVHKRASQPVYGIAKQKRGFASLSFSMTYVIENGGTSLCRVSAHPFPDAHLLTVVTRQTVLPGH
jgi:hypothetical protein